MKYNIPQNSFVFGEVSPTMSGRRDLEQYANGCETLENFIVRPQGGISRRRGTKFCISSPGETTTGPTWAFRPYDIVDDSVEQDYPNTRINDDTKPSWSGNNLNKSKIRIVPFSVDVDEYKKNFLLVFNNLYVWAYEINDDGSITPFLEEEIKLPLEKIASAIDTTNTTVQGQYTSNADSSSVSVDGITVTEASGVGTRYCGAYSNAIKIYTDRGELPFGSGMGPYKIKKLDGTNPIYSDGPISPYNTDERPILMGYPYTLANCVTNPPVGGAPMGQTCDVISENLYLGITGQRAAGQYSMAEGSEPSNGISYLTFSGDFVTATRGGPCNGFNHGSASGTNIFNPRNRTDFRQLKSALDVKSVTLYPVNEDGTARTEWRHQHHPFSVASEYLDNLTYVTTGNTLYVTIGSTLLSFRPKVDNKIYNLQAFPDADVPSSDRKKFYLSVDRTNLYTDGPIYSGVQVSTGDNDSLDNTKGIKLYGEGATRKQATLRQDFSNFWTIPGTNNTISENAVDTTRLTSASKSYYFPGWYYAEGISMFNNAVRAFFDYLSPFKNSKPPVSPKDGIGSLILKLPGDNEWVHLVSPPWTDKDYWERGLLTAGVTEPGAFRKTIDPYGSLRNLITRKSDSWYQRGVFVKKGYTDPSSAIAFDASVIASEWAFGSQFDSMNYGLNFANGLTKEFINAAPNPPSPSFITLEEPYLSWHRPATPFGPQKGNFDQTKAAYAAQYGTGADYQSYLSNANNHIKWNNSSCVKAMSFFNGRLVLSGGRNPAYVCFSSTDFLPNPRFIPISDNGVWTSDAYASGAFIFDAKGFNESQSEVTGYIEIEDDLLIFTPDRVFKMATAQQSGGFSVTSAYLRPLNKFGASNAGFINLEDTGVYASADGKRIYRIELGGEEESYKTEDMTVYSDHVVKTQISSMAATTIPFPSVWALTKPSASDATATSEIVNLTVMRGQSVQGVSRHIIAGAAGDVPLDICSMQTSSGDPVVFYVMKRTVNGSEKWYIESMKTGVDVNRSISDQQHLDCRVTYDSGASAINQVPANTFIALAGHTVDLWNEPHNGATPFRIGTTTITATGIFSQVLASTVTGKITAGLRYTSTLRTLPQDLNVNSGATTQELRTVKSISLDVMDSFGGKFAYVKEDRTDSSTLDDIPYSTDTPSLLNESIHCEVDADSDRRGSVVVKTDDPYPLDINQIVYSTDYSVRGGPNR